MNVGILGTEPGRENDPVCVIPASPLDAQILEGPLNKERREDLQMLAFTFAVSIAFDGGHPIDIRPGGDPPDRVIRVNGLVQSVELTELTVFDVRRGLATARELGRELRNRLRGNPSSNAHLFGRRVALAVVPGESLPRDRESLLDKLCVLLQTDRGWIGEDVDFTKGLPDRWPSDRGLYGQTGPVHVSLYPDGRPGEIVVSAVCQAELRLSEALHALESRVQAKDSASSDVLVMSCGMLDHRGYQCPLDTFLFRFIAENRERVQLSPRHLKGIFLHLWGTTEWLQLWRSNTSHVWPSLQKGDCAAL